MIGYEPKRWWRGLFSYRGTVLPQVWPRVVALTLITAGVCVVSILIQPIPKLDAMAHSLMGVVLGLLLVFRTNTSNDRYWEGRRLWGGLVNASRNLVRAASGFGLPLDELARSTTAYVMSIRHHLRGETDLSDLNHLVPKGVVDAAQNAANPPSVFAHHVSQWIVKQVPASLQNGQVYRALEGYLSAMVDHQGGCERIQKTPIPFVYAVHLRHLMMIYILTLPFVLVPVMGWVSPFAVAVVSFGLLGIEEAGLETEDPFGTDPNDLPLDAICEVIDRDTKTLAGLPG